MEAVLEWGARLGPAQVAGGALLVNLLLFLVAVGAGGWLVRRFGECRVAPVPGPVLLALVVIKGSDWVE
jgi:flagellar biogenesis protein FliO